MGKEKAMLLYDSKCELCRNLAYKVQFHSQERITILALSTPKAEEMLREQYPNGWTHNFYLFDGNVCREGALALSGLIKYLGLRKTSSLLGEYLSFKLSSKVHEYKSRYTYHKAEDIPASPSCVTNEDTDKVFSRRKALTYGAMGAVLFPVAAAAKQVPNLDSPFEKSLQESGSSLGQLSAQVAKVGLDGGGGYTVDVSNCSECIRSTERFEDQEVVASGNEPEQELLSHDERTLQEAEFADGSALMVHQTNVRGQRRINGQLRDRWMDVTSVALDHARYNLSVNVGYGTLENETGDYGEASTMAGMINHDLNVPIVDLIVYEDSDNNNVVGHLDAYIAGIKALEEHHRSNGLQEVANVYAGIGNGLEESKTSYENAIHERYSPIRNELLITPIPQYLKFVDFSHHKADGRAIGEEGIEVPIVTNGCGSDCGWSCGWCCSCSVGCGCSFPCGCGCGFSCCCGYECSYGCGVSCCL